MTTSAGAESALYHKESWVTGANRLAAEPSLEFGRFRVLLRELAGPRVYTYQELLRTIACQRGHQAVPGSVPFNLWHVIGFVSETLPRPPITRNQVELMGQDNIPEPDAPGFEALQISPQAIENILPQMLQTAREKAEA